MIKEATQGMNDCWMKRSSFCPCGCLLCGTWSWCTPLAARIDRCRLALKLHVQQYPKAWPFRLLFRHWPHVKKRTLRWGLPRHWWQWTTDTKKIPPKPKTRPQPFWMLRNQTQPLWNIKPCQYGGLEHWKWSNQMDQMSCQVKPTKKNQLLI